MKTPACGSEASDECGVVRCDAVRGAQLLLLLLRLLCREWTDVPAFGRL
eukprot:COSAG01_NODE_9176_length_2528_cov_1.963374_1_plen_48_part_10